MLPLHICADLPVFRTNFFHFKASFSRSLCIFPQALCVFSQVLCAFSQLSGVFLRSVEYFFLAPRVFSPNFWCFFRTFGAFFSAHEVFFLNFQVFFSALGCFFAECRIFFQTLGCFFRTFGAFFSAHGVFFLNFIGVLIDFHAFPRVSCNIFIFLHDFPRVLRYISIPSSQFFLTFSLFPEFLTQVPAGAPHHPAQICIVSASKSLILTFLMEILRQVFHIFNMISRENP